MIQANLKGIELNFKTADGVFSPSAIDKGTLAMLSAAEFKVGDKILDLGCGYGVVGILAAKIVGAENVVMTDISEQAIELAQANARLNAVETIMIIQSDGFNKIDSYDYSVILSNPPYHTDFSIARGFIENSFRHLAIGGRLYMVTKRLTWYKNKIISVFSGVKVSEIGGYYVFMAEKRVLAESKNREKKSRRSMSRKLERKKK